MVLLNKGKELAKFFLFAIDFEEVVGGGEVFIGEERKNNEAERE